MPEYTLHDYDEDKQPASAGSRSTPCSHGRRIYVADTAEGLGHIAVYWCPDCGGLKKRMTNWKYTEYPWQIPRRVNEGPPGSDYEKDIPGSCPPASCSITKLPTNSTP